MHDQDDTPETVAGTVSGSGYDYGPLQTFEVTWMSGHVETVQGHQFHSDASSAFAFGQAVDRPQFVRIHGCIDRPWQLVLQARAEDVRIIRNITAGESIPGGDLL